MIDITKVKFSRYEGGGDFSTWIKDACASSGVPYNRNWHCGMKTLCERESSLNPNAVNDWDKNASGPTVSDGKKQNCSRGIAQCIPSTFAKYHSSETSWSIYDPVANISSSINYITYRYGVAPDGSDLADKVQQADPTRDAQGYVIVDEA